MEVASIEVKPRRNYATNQEVPKYTCIIVINIAILILIIDLGMIERLSLMYTSLLTMLFAGYNLWMRDENKVYNITICMLASITGIIPYVFSNVLIV